MFRIIYLIRMVNRNFTGPTAAGNAAVRDIIEHSGSTVKRQLEILVSGESIEQEIIPEMTYHDLDTEDNNGRIRYLWSLLYNTGYLTSV